MSDQLSNEQIDKIIDRLVDRLENDSSFQQKLLGLVLKAVASGGLGGLGGLFGGSKKS